MLWVLGLKECHQLHTVLHSALAATLAFSTETPKEPMNRCKGQCAKSDDKNSIPHISSVHGPLDRCLLPGLSSLVLDAGFIPTTQDHTKSIT